MKKIAVLGASGSIGKSALDVLRNGDFDPVLFSAHTDYNALLKLKVEFPGASLALSGASQDPCADPGGKINFYGRRGLLDAITGCGADIIINGISGAAGLEPSIAALNAGSVLALANKETIVMAGPLVLGLEKEKNAKIIPVDSEHSAIFNLINAFGKENIDEIILTASGGPFRDLSSEELANVTPDMALSHPTWNMGPKITIDSATLANKGLEVIEASRLFGLAPEKIRVIIHPQSIIHSMVRLKDGMIYAQMSKPDMRNPIHNALYWPEILPSSFDVLELEGSTLSFFKPDSTRFPMLPLAYTALEKSPLHPVIYNAANETAVKAFLEKRISFLEIPRIVGYVLKSKEWPENCREPDLEEILYTDKKAGEMARQYRSDIC